MSNPSLSFSELRARQAEREKAADFFNQRERAMLNTAWCDKNTVVRLLSWNSESAVTEIVAVVNIMRTSGSIDRIPLRQTPTSDRAINIDTFDIGEGWITGVACATGLGTNKLGDTYMRVELLDTKDSQIVQSLYSDYVVSDKLAYYPQTSNRDTVGQDVPTKFVTGTNPAAGSEITEEVPTNAIWELVSLRAQLVTDANVASRQVAFAIDDGATPAYVIQAPSTQAASTTYNYNIVEGIDTAALIGLEIRNTYGRGILLQGGSRIITSTGNIQVGDNWGAPIMLIKEWKAE